MAWIDTKTEPLRGIGQRTADRDCERNRKDLEIAVTMAKTNESVEVENHLTWNCLVHLYFFILYVNIRADDVRADDVRADDVRADDEQP